jgi:serine/threonine-protein kinase
MPLALGALYADKYRIVRQLGEGAMGAVYEGENVRIHRKVAIKVLHAHVAGKGDALQRFEREAQAAGRIGSEHIIEVLDMGELPDGSRFMVMEFLEGSTLDQRIRSRRRLSPEEASPILCQLLEGLAAAHAAQIIHRDLKPANVFLASRGGDFVKILDFGVSKFNVLSDEMSMTSTGAVLGTPFYMSPEQAKGSRQIDLRSDLYAAGVILYECITGQVPFSAETFNELIFRIVLESPPPVESFVPDLDPAFIAIVRKAMAREPDERFQTAQAFHEALAAWLARATALPALPPIRPPLETVPLLAGAGTLVMVHGPDALEDMATLLRDPPGGAAAWPEPPAAAPPPPPLVLPVTAAPRGPQRTLVAVAVSLFGLLVAGVVTLIVLSSSPQAAPNPGLSRSPAATASAMASAPAASASDSSPVAAAPAAPAAPPASPEPPATAPPAPRPAAVAPAPGGQGGVKPRGNPSAPAPAARPGKRTVSSDL